MARKPKPKGESEQFVKFKSLAMRVIRPTIDETVIIPEETPIKPRLKKSKKP